MPELKVIYSSSGPSPSLEPMAELILTPALCPPQAHPPVSHSHRVSRRSCSGEVHTSPVLVDPMLSLKHKSVPHTVVLPVGPWVVMCCQSHLHVLSYTGALFLWSPIPLHPQTNVSSQNQPENVILGCPQLGIRLFRKGLRDLALTCPHGTSDRPKSPTKGSAR